MGLQENNKYQICLLLNKAQNFTQFSCEKPNTTDFDDFLHAQFDNVPALNCPLSLTELKQIYKCFLYSDSERDLLSTYGEYYSRLLNSSRVNQTNI